jgi:hypothetical protein
LICNQLNNLQTDLAALVIAAERTADVEVSALPEAERNKHKLLKKMIEKRRVDVAEELATHVAEHRCAN